MANVRAFLRRKLHVLSTFQYWKTFAIRGFLFGLILELVLMLASELGWLNFELPTYEMHSATHLYATYDPDLGFVHTPNSHFESRLNCTSFSLDFNRKGFRDRDRPKNSKKKRGIVLGDSFMEGYGLKREKRVSNQIEKKRGIPLINLGVSGTGPTQYMEIYRKYGQHFDHDFIVLSLYPPNDFIDDDPVLIENKHRPFWVLKNDTLVLQKPQKKTPDLHYLSWFKQILQRYTYTYNAYLEAKKQIRANMNAKFDLPNHQYKNPLAMRRFFRSIVEIKKMANGRPIVLFTIPCKQELGSKNLGNSRVSRELRAFCVAQNIEFIDLPKIISQKSLKEQQSLYLTCDSHFSEKGAEFVATILLKNCSFFAKN